MKHARPDYNRIQDPDKLIPKDEPVFLIRGQDVVAPKVLMYYAALARDAGANADLVEAVEQHARRMEEWQECRARKVPDL